MGTNPDQVQPEQTEPTEPQEENQPPEPDTEETPAEEAEPKGEEPEGGAKEAEGQDQQTAEAKKHQRAGGWQRKIERLERQNQMLVEQLTSNRPAQQQQPGETKPKDSAAQVEEYISTMVEKRLQEREERDRQTRQQAEFQKRTQEVRAANADFDDVMLSADTPVSQALQQALLTSEQGPAIMYQLAKSPAELARLNALPPLDAAREIGRLEAKASFTPAPKTNQKPANRPPVPPTTVGGSPSTTRNLDDLPISEYKRAFRSRR